MAKYKPGECGNRLGRPKGSKNKTKLPDRLKKAALEKVVVQEGGRQRKVDKLDVALTQMMNKAAQGQPSFLKMALAELKKAEAAEPTTKLEELAEPDKQVIAQVIQRILQQGGQV
jgi:argonaute-like protein implicated in RNA metabolism and viral defense